MEQIYVATPFHRDKCGMADLGKDVFYEDLRYLEATEARSTAFTERTK